jgi:hypothetical protein
LFKKIINLWIKNKINTMDPNKSLRKYYFAIQTDDFKMSIANKKPCPRLKPGSKSQIMILTRPFVKNIDKELYVVYEPLVKQS